VPTSAPQILLSVPPILPQTLRSWAEPLAPALHKLLIPTVVMGSFESARRSGTGARFARRMLELLDIRFWVDEGDLERIPAQGPAMIVANHPYGIVEGLILMAMLDRVRQDLKILANSLLGGIPELREQMILVNPFETPTAQNENRAPLRAALDWLAGGGLLSVFPAGEVAHLDWKEHSVTDPQWKTSAARLALHTRCAVVPAFFEGANSIPFQLAGILHPSLRTMALAREFGRMRGRTVRLRIGSPIRHGMLAGYGNAEQATAYMRSRTFFLSNRSEPALSSPLSSPRVRTIAPPGAERLLSGEVAALPAECEVAGDKNYSVYLAPASRIPRMLAEIGRSREVAFRKVGEGTGKHADLDRFDEYYRHLFLWNKTDSRLAGAYRLAATSDVLPRFGISGLYTSTLFRFHPQFFERIGPAVELGRSFVAPEYQKSYAPLLLLWKGIARAVERRPEAPVLFGAVSISPEYRAASRSLMAAYLSDHASHELARLVAPRRKFRDRAPRNRQIKRFAAVAADIEDLSLSIADIEDDGKGVPVLIRQYLKAGGRVLGFSVDPNFSDTLDGLILVDLRSAPLPLLERSMGRLEARAFQRRVQNISLTKCFAETTHV
jgi:putative hemolysin